MGDKRRSNVLRGVQGSIVGKEGMPMTMRFGREPRDLSRMVF